MTKLVLISDSHQNHRKLEIPEADILIHCGDITYFNKNPLEVLSDFNEWAGSLPVNEVIAIGGNHDVFLEQNPDKAELILSNCTYLNEEVADHDGLRIFGSAWTPWYGGWAFNYEEEDAIEIWSHIPEDIDILVTHGPPRGFFDNVGRQKVGCPDLLNRVLEIKPKVHVFGHLHQRQGIRSFNETLFINCAVADNTHQIVNKPIEIEI